jgi:Thioredoxin like C-terminal domain
VANATCIDGYYQSTGFAQAEEASFDEPLVYTPPGRLPLNFWGLSGNWTMTGDAVVLNERAGRIAFQFHARDLNLVMGPSPQERRFRSAFSSTASSRRTLRGATWTRTAAGWSATSAPVG